MKNAIPKSMTAASTPIGMSTLEETPKEDEDVVGVFGVAVSSSPPPLVRLESASEEPRLAPLPPEAEPAPVGPPVAVPAPAAPVAPWAPSPFSARAFARASWTALLSAALFTVGVPAAAAVLGARTCPAQHMASNAARSGIYEEIRRIGLEGSGERE